MRRLKSVAEYQVERDHLERCRPYLGISKEFTATLIEMMRDRRAEWQHRIGIGENLPPFHRG